VKRNQDRFPDDLMFQLTLEEKVGKHDTNLQAILAMLRKILERQHNHSAAVASFHLFTRQATD